MSDKKLDLGSWVNDVVQHLLDNYSVAFDSVGHLVSGFSEGIEQLLMLPPAWLPTTRTRSRSSSRDRSWDAVTFDRPVLVPSWVLVNGPPDKRSSSAARSLSWRSSRGVPGR